MLGLFKHTPSCKLISAPYEYMGNVDAQLISKDKNLKTSPRGTLTGRYTTLAIQMLYDRLINKLTLTEEEKEEFTYTIFNLNMLWWVDATIGLESRWDHTARNQTAGSTAYGWGQMIYSYPLNAANSWDNMIDYWNTTRGVSGLGIPNDALPSSLEGTRDASWSKYLLHINLDDLSYDDDLYEDGKLLVPDYIKRIKDKGKISKGNFKAHKAIVDSLSYDETCSLIIQMAGTKGSDEDHLRLMASPDINVVKDAAKKLYEYGHHSTGTGFKSTTPDLQNIKDNMEKFYDCPQTPSNALAAGTNQTGIVPAVANPCTPTGGLEVAKATADYIMGKFDFKDIDDFAVAMYDRGWMINDVTAHIPTDISKLVVASLYKDPRVDMHKVYRMYHIGLDISHYIVHTNDLEKAKLAMRANLIKDINSTGNPDEIFATSKIAFPSKTTLYLGGITIYHEDPWSVASFTLPKEARASIKPYTRITVGNVQLFHSQFVTSTNATELRCVYYGPDKGELATEVLNGAKFKTLSGVEWPIENKNFIDTLNAWEFDPVFTKILDKVNKDREYYYKDFLKIGNKSKYVTLGSYHGSKDIVTLSLCNKIIGKTLFHEVGGHRIHGPDGATGWGSGDNVLFTQSEIVGVVDAMREARDNGINDLYDIWSNLPGDTSFEGDAEAFNKFTALKNAVRTNILTSNLMVLTNINNYKPKDYEDEFLARVYGSMVMYKCTTFKADFYPKLQLMGVSLRPELVDEIDRIMREEMLLDKRVYGEAGEATGVDKRSNLKNHLRDFFAKAKGSSSSLSSSFAALLSGTVLYDDDASKLRDLESFIGTSVDALPDDAYILNHPEFYLPINSNNPDIILASSIGGNKLAWYTSILGNPILAISLSDSPINVLAQLIHEYGHHVVVNSNIDIPTTNNLANYYIQELTSFEWDDWVNIKVDDYHIYLMSYGNMDTNSFNDMGSINRNNYNFDSLLINETIVRMRSNVAMDSKFRSMVDVFPVIKQKVIFTPKFLDTLNGFIWP